MLLAIRFLYLLIATVSDEFDNTTVSKNLKLLTNFGANIVVIRMFFFKNAFKLIHLSKRKLGGHYSVHTVKNIEKPSARFKIINFHMECTFHIFTNNTFFYFFHIFDDCNSSL